MDLHLIGEGRHETLWDVLGAHVQHYKSSLGDVDGVSSPCGPRTPRPSGSRATSTHWDGSEHSMRSLGSSGVWELFIPGVAAGAVLQVRDLDQARALGGKSGPAGLRHRGPAADGIPGGRTAYAFKDAGWMERAPPAIRTTRR